MLPNTLLVFSMTLFFFFLFWKFEMPIGYGCKLHYIEQKYPYFAFAYALVHSNFAKSEF
jgi:hypothetical protein